MVDYKNRIEEKITEKLKDFLFDNGWEIVAYHPPGGHSSFVLLDENNRRSRGAIMPDIVAKKQKDNLPYILVVESKPIFLTEHPDVKKLINMNKRHVEFLQLRLQLSDEWLENCEDYLQKVIAVGKFDTSIKIPDKILVIEVKDSGIKLFFGKDCCITEKSILK